jgi:endonuclease/exonuclease/phosphatase family metal-dependent hydrolase
MKKTAAFLSGFPLLFLLSCTACSLPFGEKNQQDVIEIVSWNVQNLFDDVSDGGEYDEFNPDKGVWNRDLFNIRLNRVEEVFDSLFDNYPHIILLQEIENLHTLGILNSDFLKTDYQWQVLIEREDMSVATAVLSRIPIKSITILETGYWGQYKLRPITEIHFDLNNKELVIFNNHWKSKSGGSAATEEGRIKSAQILTDRIKKMVAKDPQLLLLAAGDFNENHDEYKKVKRKYRTALIPVIEDVPVEWDDSLFVTSKKSVCSVSDNRLVLYSPWYVVLS